MPERSRSDWMSGAPNWMTRRARVLALIRSILEERRAARAALDSAAS